MKESGGSRVDKIKDERLSIRELLNQWLKSGEAEKQIKEASVLTKKIIDEINEKRKVDLDTLNKPFTI